MHDSEVTPRTAHESAGSAWRIDEHGVVTADFVVDDYLSGVRIDSFLIRCCRNYTSHRMQRIVRAGQARIEGAVAPITQRVFKGQRVSVRLIEPPDKLLDPYDGPVEIVHEDEWIIVVNKSPDQIVHPVGNAQHTTLANALQHHLDQQTIRRGLLRPGIVHRLDRETSGAIVIAKDHLSHRRLSIALQRGRVSKTYFAIVEGTIAQDRGVIDLPIGRVRAGRGVLMSARADARSAKPAKTVYEVVERLCGATTVRANPLTGRNHQIRVHLAAIGHPVIGDEFYAAHGEIKPSRLDNLPQHPGDEPIGNDSRGEREVENLSADDLLDAISDTSVGRAPRSPWIDRHALHAERLGFAHPMSHEWIDYRAPLPADMRRAIEALRATAAG